MYTGAVSNSVGQESLNVSLVTSSQSIVMSLSQCADVI